MSDYQIDYIVQRSNLLNNDIIMFHIFGSLVYNQNLFMKKNGKSNHFRDEWWNDIIHMGDKKGISAMTISDLTGIEDFIGLVYLNCNYNPITSLDISVI